MYLICSLIICPTPFISITSPFLVNHSVISIYNPHTFFSYNDSKIIIFQVISRPLSTSFEKLTAEKIKKIGAISVGIKYSKKLYNIISKRRITLFGTNV